MSQLQALLNDGLIRTKHVENAAIININERKVCASTSGFYVPPENAINLIYTFYNNLMQVRREGLYFKQKHYKCVRADEDSIYLKNQTTLETRAADSAEAMNFIELRRTAHQANKSRCSMRYPTPASTCCFTTLQLQSEGCFPIFISRTLEGSLLPRGLPYVCITQVFK
eukprot:XP_012948854.1 profilin-4 isoform X3 [Anas platyrhynchos]